MGARFQTERILSVLLIGTVPVAAQVTATARSRARNAFDQLGTGAAHLAHEQGADAGLGVLLQRRRVLHAPVLFHDLVLEDLLLSFEVVELVREVFRLLVEVVLLLQRLAEQFVVLRQQHRHLVHQIALVLLQRCVPLRQHLALVVQLADFHVHVRCLLKINPNHSFIPIFNHSNDIN